MVNKLKERIEELERLCAEAYQVVGLLADEAGRFGNGDPHVEKILDNLSEARIIHEDVLPFPSRHNVDAHELWAAAQLAPGEGIGGAVSRIEALLQASTPTNEGQAEPVAAPQPVADEHERFVLRFIARVLESNAPKEDREKAAQMLRDMRRQRQQVISGCFGGEQKNYYTKD